MILGFTPRISRLDDILDEPLVTYPSGCDIRRVIEQEYHRRGKKPNIVLEIEFGESVLGFVAVGAGITLVPAMTALHLGPSPLVTVPVPEREVKRTISLVASSEETGKTLLRHLARPDDIRSSGQPGAAPF